MQRRVEISRGHPLCETLDELEVGGQTFLYPMLKADDDALALAQHDLAGTEAGMSDPVALLLKGTINAPSRIDRADSRFGLHAEAVCRTHDEESGLASPTRKPEN